MGYLPQRIRSTPQSLLSSPHTCLVLGPNLVSEVLSGCHGYMCQIYPRDGITAMQSFQNRLFNPLESRWSFRIESIWWGPFFQCFGSQKLLRWQRLPTASGQPLTNRFPVSKIPENRYSSLYYARLKDTRSR